MEMLLRSRGVEGLMPVFVPVVAGTVVRYAVGGTIAYVVGKQVVATASDEAGDTIDDIENQLLGAGAEIIQGTAQELGSISLQFVEGFGAAFIRGLDGAYDAIRDKLRGKEPAVISGFTVAAVAVLTLVYLYQSAKAARDAF